MSEPVTLPADVHTELSRFVDTAREMFGPDLSSVVLFGSGAEGRLRPTSDVNLLLVLERFDRVRADGIRAALRTARALIRLEVMFLLRAELPDALDAFGVKFADILVRHRVLHGADPFAGMTVDDAALRARLQQVLLNLALRLRERYVVVSLREEQLAPLAADVAGPLRGAAAALMRLEGRPAATPKAALETLVGDLGVAEGPALLALVSQARERGVLPPGEGARVVLFMADVAQRLRERARGGGGRS